MSNTTILCVDDERNVLLTLRTQLLRHFPDYRVEIAESGDEVLELVDELLAKGSQIPLIIADQIMPGMKGDELLIELHARHPQMLKVMLTGQAKVEDLGNIVNRGNLYRFIAKPWSEIDLQLTVTEALRRYQQEQQLAQQQLALEQANQELAALNADLARQVQERTQRLEQEIQHRQQKEDDLRLSEERYRLLSEVSPVGIFRSNFQGGCTYANAKTLEITELSLAEILGDGWGQHLHPEDRDWLYIAWTEFIEQVNLGYAVDYQVEYRALCASGRVKWIVAQAVPEQNAAGELVGFIGSIVDITDRKLAELALRDSEQRYVTLAEALPVGIFRKNPTGVMIYANDRLGEMTGLRYTDGWTDGCKVGLDEGWHEGCDDG
jgi:PAS domain S-box-containing protein